MDTITLLPADRYVIYNKTILTDFDRKILTTFYEPIIGHLAISLYLTLSKTTTLRSKPRPSCRILPSTEK